MKNIISYTIKHMSAMLSIVKSIITIFLFFSNLFALIFFLTYIITNILKNNSNIKNKANTPKGFKIYVQSLKIWAILAKYLVPPHNGQGFPVIAKYGHIPKDGNIFLIGMDIKGKKITYIDNTNNVILKYM